MTLPPRRDLTLAVRTAALTVLLALFGQLCAPTVAQANDYPEKKVRILVGFPPGSASELSLRALVQVASKHFRKPLIVLNKPGASQSIAMGELAAAVPDGYTIGMTTDGFRSLTIHQQKVRFDPKVLKVVLGYARIKHVLFVRGDSPLAKYDDFIAFGRKGAGTLVYGGTGEGTGPDLIGKVFFRDDKVRPTYVPFKGSNEYIAAVLGGHLQSGIIDISGIRRQAQAGTVKLVVVFDDQRLDEFPDVPSSFEKGHRDLTLFNPIRCIVAHRDVPAERIKVLHDVFRKAIEDPEFRKLAEESGLNAVYFSPQTVEDGIVKTERIGVPVLKELNMFVE